MVIVMGLAATMMRPDLDGRRAREAARSVNVYLASARNRAMETGRDCGVILHRRSPRACLPPLSIDQVEVPPTFAGQNIGAVVRVQDWTGRDRYWTDGSTILLVQRATPGGGGPGSAGRTIFPGPAW